MYSIRTYDAAQRVDVLRLKQSDGTVLQSFDNDYGFTGTTRDADYHSRNILGVACYYVNDANPVPLLRAPSGQSPPESYTARHPRDFTLAF
ncbi:MAG TPA: hypothetical protein VF707_19285 [Ardenticatenaceae bacterium]